MRSDWLGFVPANVLLAYLVFWWLAINLTTLKWQGRLSEGRVTADCQVLWSLASRPGVWSLLVVSANAHELTLNNALVGLTLTRLMYPP